MRNLDTERVAAKLQRPVSKPEVVFVFLVCWVFVCGTAGDYRDEKSDKKSRNNPAFF
jgi:hypothetical protein